MTVASTDNVQRRSIDLLLRQMTEQGASDLHLQPTRPPLIRVHGRLMPIEASRCARGHRLHVDAILQPHQKAKLEESLSVDLGYGVHGLARFRGNIYMQRGTLAAAFRRIPYEIKAVEDLELPGRCSTSATCRWAWCWSPARPAAASRPRSRR